MSKPSPKVSVIIPTKNRASMLSEAIESVKAQTFSDWECIVVDDGSTDQTKDVLSQYSKSEPRVRVIQQESSGVSKARNTAILAARGSYIAFLDDDDLLIPESLALRGEYLDTHPDIGLVYGQRKWRYQDKCLTHIDPVMPSTNLRELFEHCDVPLQTVMCRRQIFDQAGLFDERLSIGEDYDLWLRMVRLTTFGFIAKPLVIYRSHGANTCQDTLRLYQQRDQVLKRVPIDPSRGLTFWVKRVVLARNAYRVARLHREVGNYFNAALQFLRSVSYCPWIGSVIVKSKPSGIKVLWFCIKPYAAIGVCFLQSLTRRKKSVKSETPNVHSHPA